MSKKVDANAIIAALAEWFPNAIACYERRRRPLKHKIHLDILAATGGAITAQELRRAMRVYTAGNEWYLRSLRAGAVRLDLNGEPAGQVTADEAAHALTILEARKRDRAPANGGRLGAAKPAAVNAAAPAPTEEETRLAKGIAALRAAARARREAPARRTGEG